jgi:dipeptidyl aminopeptidase/acylaminoacyl peptidase
MWPLRRLSIVIVLLALLGSGTVLAEGTGAGATTTTQAKKAVTWVDEPVSFQAAGMRVYATFRHPVGATSPVPAVLLIAGSGPTDRDGNSAVEPGPIDTIKTLADWLSQDGAASLRYDKLGSGQTGLGPFADKIDSIGITVYEKAAAAALTFLSRQSGVDDQRLAVFGHSHGPRRQGATHPRPGTL